jgi:LysR family hydrogen peroxide-inducible transcriptional activator
MNLRDLEYLVALDEERHFNRAAARCFVSQPTLSGQLRKLEERLGVTLVERTSRQVVMTDVGRAVAERARRVLAEAHEVREIARSFRDPMAGELQVGLIPTVGPYLLPLLMPAVKREFPRLKLFLHEYQTSVLLERLREGGLDLLILALPVDSDEFSEIDLYEEPFRLAAPPEDDLALAGSATVESLGGREVLLLEEGHCLRGQALDVCVQGGASEYAGFRATSLETLRHMVGEGLGITLMPELAVPASRGENDAVRYIPFEPPVPTRRIGMLYRRSSYREPLFQSLAGTVRESVGRLKQNAAGEKIHK